jgi:hypothetical protein
VVENFRTRAGVIPKRRASARQIQEESGITVAAVKTRLQTSWPSPSMMATATVTARAGIEIRFGGNTAQFDRFGNGFLNEMLHLVQLFLRIEKSTRNGILHQVVAMFFEVGNFSAFERLRPRLFFLKRLPLAHHRFILAARAGVGQKGVNALADGNHFRLVNDGLAQFFGLGFNLCGHKI